MITVERWKEQSEDIVKPLHIPSLHKAVPAISVFKSLSVTGVTSVVVNILSNEGQGWSCVDNEPLQACMEI